MSFNDFSDFVMPEIEERKALPDGEYTAQIDDMECVTKAGRTSYVVKLRILRPSEFEGEVHREWFMVNNESNEARHIHIQKFAKFCAAVCGLSKGESLDEKKIIYKIVKILIKNNTAKNGNKFANVERWELADQHQQAQPSPLGNTIGDALEGTSTEPIHGINFKTYPSANLNDDVPF